jgi:8-amino-7-oxononanoate synthase
MNTRKFAYYEEQLAALAGEDRLRRLNPVEARDGAYVTRDGRKLLNLSSNDYLGLAGDAGELASFYEGRTAANTLDAYGLGSSASRLMTGSTRLSEELEATLAERYGRAALLFNSGYHANLGILPALAGRRDLILSDKLNHASIIDGLRLSEAQHLRYRHGDWEHCGSLLEKERSQCDKVFVVTESIFSMDGDTADLREFVRLKNRYGAFLYVDEAHAVGVRGATGLGVCEEQGVVAEVDVLLGTFGKALASLGAYAVVGAPLKPYLVNTMRPFIFTTALPPVVVNWNLRVFGRLAGLSRERAALRDLSDRFRRAVGGTGLETRGDSQIVPVIVGENARAVALADKLLDEGYLALPIRPPTVPPGSARLRFSLCAHMTWEDVAAVPGLMGGFSGGRS